MSSLDQEFALLAKQITRLNVLVEEQEKKLDRLLKTMDNFSRFSEAQASLDKTVQDRLDNLESTG